MGLKGGAGVVGDAQPFQAEFGASLGHGLQGVLAIAGHGVVVKTATDLFPGDQIGKFLFLRSLDFTLILADFGWYVFESKSSMQILLFLEG